MRALESIYDTQPTPALDDDMAAACALKLSGGMLDIGDISRYRHLLASVHKWIPDSCVLCGYVLMLISLPASV